MTSLTTAARETINSMYEDPSGTSVTLFDKASGQSVMVTVNPKDTVESIKTKLQDALGTSPEYVNLKNKDGSILRDTDVLALVAKGSEETTHELLYEVGLNGGVKVDVACCHILCCDRMDFFCRLTLGCCIIGKRLLSPILILLIVSHFVDNP